MKWNKCSLKCKSLPVISVSSPSSLWLIFSREVLTSVRLRFSWHWTQSFGAFYVFARCREHSFSKLNDSNLTYERKLDIVTTCFRSNSGKCK